MNKNKIMAKVIITSLLSITVLSGCSNIKKQPQPVANTPENKEVKVLTNVTGGKDEEEMKLFQAQLGKATGLQVSMEKPASDYNKVLMQKLQAGEKYDLVYLTQDQLPSLVQQGVFKDITEDIKKSKVLADTSIIPEGEWNDIKIDGKLYAGFNKRELHRVVNVNSVIASKAGVDSSKIEPTLEGYYQVFKKMKEYNDKNEKAKDFYAFNAALVQMYDLQPWFASLGLKGGIVINNNKKTVPWASDEATPVWEWLRKLYVEGLMDKDALTDTTKELRSKFQAGKSGMVVDWAAWTGLYNSNAGSSYPNSFSAYPLAGTKASNGKYILTRGQASLWSIPVNAQNASGALKLIEYFATQEGGELLSIGIEGHDYTKENSKYILTEIGKKHSSDHGAPVPTNIKFKHPIGWNPGFEDAMKYLEFASTEKALPETSKYTEVVAKHAVRIIKGDINVKDGLAAMRAELKQASVID